MVLYQYRFIIICNKCTTLMGDIDNGGGYPCICGADGKSQYFLNFAVNLKLL